MGRPSNAVRAERERLKQSAEAAAARAERLRIAALAAGQTPSAPEQEAEGGDGGENGGNGFEARPALPPPDGPDLSVLRGRGRVYIMKIVNGTETQRLPAMDREILSVDGKEIPEAWGDGTYRLKFHDEHSAYKGGMTVTFSGYGEGKRNAELRQMMNGGQPVIQAAPAPDPELQRMVRDSQEKIDKLNEKILSMQTEHSREVLAMMNTNNQQALKFMEMLATRAQPVAAPVENPETRLLSTLELIDRIRGPRDTSANAALKAEGSPLGALGDLTNWIKENKEILEPLMGVKSEGTLDWSDKVAKILVAGGPIVDRILSRIPQRLHQQPPAAPVAQPVPLPQVDPGVGQSVAEVVPIQPITPIGPQPAAPEPAPRNDNGNGNGNGNGHKEGEVIVDEAMKAEAAKMAQVKDSFYYKQYVPKLLGWAREKRDVTETAHDILDLVTNPFAPEVAIDVLFEIVDKPPQDMVLGLAAYEPEATQHDEWLAALAKEIVKIYDEENPPDPTSPPVTGATGDSAPGAGAGSPGGSDPGAQA